MISRDTIDEVRSRIDIVDVISDFISLKKSGQNYKALSPFNNEKTPSFFVVPGKGIFKDFSSGKGGDAITFVMEHEGMTYPEAIRFLAKKYGVDIKEDAQSEESRQQQSEREGLYILMTFAKDFYRKNLLDTDEGRSIGLSYFRERGFHDGTMEKFELGYALEGWNNLQDEALRRNYSKELLEKTGLVVHNEEGKVYDRFRGRVIFPVHSLTGKVIAFGARMMGRDKNQPKYINSPETEIYHKGRTLYGLYQAKNTIRQKENCFLVEGYTDVLSMHQSGVENVVASSGTALTEDQTKLIRRFTENVTVLFDGDSAGIKAALRGIDLILKSGLNVRVVLLPDGEDPDSYSRKVGTVEFQKYLAQKAQDFISFKSGLYAAEAGNDPIRKAESIKEIVGSIALVPDPVKRSVYIQETSHQLKIGEPVLLTELNKLLVQERKRREREVYESPVSVVGAELVPDLASTTVDPKDSLYFTEREATRLLLNYGSMPAGNESLADLLISESEDVEFSNPTFKSILEAYRDANSKGIQLDPLRFLESDNKDVIKQVTELVTMRHTPSPNWEKFHIVIPKDSDELDKRVVANILLLKYRILQILIENNKEKIRDAKDNGEVDKLLDTQILLKKQDVEIALMLGINTGKY